MGSGKLNPNDGTFLNTFRMNEGVDISYTKTNNIDNIPYLNPLQRFASNELWDLLFEQKQTIIALRTVAGGPVHRLRDVPGVAWKEYIQKRAVEVAPIFERSGINSWTEFCIRFA